MVAENLSSLLGGKKLGRKSRRRTQTRRRRQRGGDEAEPEENMDEVFKGGEKWRGGT